MSSFREAPSPQFHKWSQPAPIGAASDNPQSRLIHSFVYTFRGKDEDYVISVGLSYRPLTLEVLCYELELCQLGDVRSTHNVSS